MDTSKWVLESLEKEDFLYTYIFNMFYVSDLFSQLHFLITADVQINIFANLHCV